MANKKISQLTPKGSALAGTDLLEVSVFNGVTYDTKSLTGANILSGTGLTIGTTAIASGTIGRILFEGTGNVVQQDAAFTFDNTLKRLQIIATTGGGGADVPLLVRNSANTLDIVKFKANGDHVLSSEGGTSLNILTKSGYSYPSLNLSGQGGTEKAGIRQTSNRLTFINTTSNTATATITTTGLAIGFGDVGASAKLDIKAAGALSTDIAFRVRNSADTTNIFQINGDSTGGWNVNGKNIKFGTGSRITTGANYLDGLVIGFSLYSCALSTAFQAQGNSINNLKQICIGGAYDDNEASAIFYNIAGTPSVVANTFKMYSNDIVAGNACPHFKTENGGIIKLYQETTAVAAATFVSNAGTTVHETSTFDGYTLEQVVKALRNTGLLA